MSLLVGFFAVDVVLGIAIGVVLGAMVIARWAGDRVMLRIARRNRRKLGHEFPFEKRG